MTNSAHEVSGEKIRSDSLRKKIRDISVKSMVPLFAPNPSPSDGIAILLLYYVALPWSFNTSIGLDEASCAGPWSRPYFVAPWIVLVAWSWALVRRRVVSQTSSTLLNCINPFPHTLRNHFFETLATAVARYMDIASALLKEECQALLSFWPSSVIKFPGLGNVSSYSSFFLIFFQEQEKQRKSDSITTTLSR